jgi:hypothetical protein
MSFESETYYLQNLSREARERQHATGLCLLCGEPEESGIFAKPCCLRAEASNLREGMTRIAQALGPPRKQGVLDTYAAEAWEVLREFGLDPEDVAGPEDGNQESPPPNLPECAICGRVGWVDNWGACGPCSDIS